MGLLDRPGNVRLFENKPMTFRQKQGQKWLILSLWIIFFVTVLFYNLFQLKLVSLVPPCVFYKLTGLYCPGCGGTRAVHYLLTGDFVGSARMNFLPLLAGGFFFLYFVQQTVNVLFHLKIRVIVLKTWMLWVFAAIVFGFWIARNIPFLLYL